MTALALCVPVQTHTPENDALRVRAEAQYDLGVIYANGRGVPEDEAVRRSVWHRRWADGGGSNFAQRSLPFTERTFG